MISYHNIKPYYVLQPSNVPVVWTQPRTKTPQFGFYGTVTKCRTVRMPYGVNSFKFAISKTERRDLNLETLQFKAQDEKGILEISNVRMIGTDILIEFKRYTSEKAEVRGEGVYTPRYNY